METNAGENVEESKKNEENKGTSYIIRRNMITKYEVARIIGTRAEQISQGAKLMIDPGNETDSLRIAKMEFKLKLIPFKIKRYLPDGSYELFALKDLIID